MSENPIRLGVLSNEELNPWVNWTTLGPPLLEVLAVNENSRLIAPPPLTWHRRREWQAVLKSVRSCDTLFWMQGPSRPELPIHVASLLRCRARRSAFVVDPWKYLITKIGALAVFQRLDPLFVSMREGFEELKRRFPMGRFEWLPFGVDTSVFDSVPGDERPIFAFWMGRRHEPLHQAMLSYCADRGLRYEYRRPGDKFLGPRELGTMVGRSRYFLVAPPDLSDPARTGGFSPFVMRYLEGLAAGARLLGVLPRSGEYEMLLSRDAILVVEADGSDLAVKLDVDRNNLVAWAAVERARMFVREHHSWAKRAEQIYDRLTTGKPIGFDEQWSQQYLP
jgi:hypothetical protein